MRKKNHNGNISCTFGDDDDDVTDLNNIVDLSVAKSIFRTYEFELRLPSGADKGHHVNNVKNW